MDIDQSRRLTSNIPLTPLFPSSIKPEITSSRTFFVTKKVTSSGGAQMNQMVQIHDGNLINFGITRSTTSIKRKRDNDDDDAYKGSSSVDDDWAPFSEKKKNAPTTLPRNQKTAVSKLRTKVVEETALPTTAQAKRAKDAGTKNRKKASKKGAPVDEHEKLESINATRRRPESFGLPSVWADKRQQLCETLPWYKAYQAGAYTHNGVAYGLMWDSKSAVRDHFDDHIIICTLGGGMVEDDAGGMIRKTDRKVDCCYAAAFKHCMDRRFPVGVIIGQGNTKCPVKLLHYYNVLGFFHVTHVWYDKEVKKCWMVKLQKMNAARPWWSVKDADYSARTVDRTATLGTCVHCKKESKQIYIEGWVCTNAFCQKNWDFGGREVDTVNLHYDPSFLQEHIATSAIPPVTSLSFPDPQADKTLVAKARTFKQGYPCPKCGCCMRRVHWTYFVCESTLGCDFEYHPRLKVMDLHESNMHGDFKKGKELVDDCIIKQKFQLGAYEVTQHLIPDEQGKTIGCVAVLRSNKAVNKQTNGPDALLKLMQSAKLDLKRNPARHGDSRGQVLTSQYGRNFGAKYKFGVKPVSQDFESSPDVILMILKRVTWAAEEIVGRYDGQEYLVPNELLCLGYHNDSKIGYHDDGESTLGPTVTSLSLGCSATMSFRPKKKNDLMKNLAKPAALKPDVLRVHLDHGDIMVMHGHTIQKLYEASFFHCVTPHGQTRFALTARHILIEKMDFEDQDDARVAGAIPARAENFAYDGDANLR
ncbi:hypothetical protein B2J93_8219 [Marssonina coronariae]|uniref:Fe2OG dioxygenase domain-containing protein n=1 Tax=Diplocarpon coronariae TaxID=2795749 RepID=A0A218YSW9_9HELO|nr:hypothetical protein B2J93_8219 [Marssonina coronariae]